MLKPDTASAPSGSTSAPRRSQRIAFLALTDIVHTPLGASGTHLQVYSITTNRLRRLCAESPVCVIHSVWRETCGTNHYPSKPAREQNFDGHDPTRGNAAGWPTESRQVPGNGAFSETGNLPNSDDSTRRVSSALGQESQRSVSGVTEHS